MQAPYRSESPIIPCCVHLRTKTQFYVPEEMRAGPGRIRLSTTAAYWCAKTSQPLGPDDEPSLPQQCQPGRSCHEAAPHG